MKKILILPLSLLLIALLSVSVFAKSDPITILAESSHYDVSYDSGDRHEDITSSFNWHEDYTYSPDTYMVVYLCSVISDVGYTRHLVTGQDVVYHAWDCYVYEDYYGNNGLLLTFSRLSVPYEHINFDGENTSIFPEFIKSFSDLGLTVQQSVTFTEFLNSPAPFNIVYVANDFFPYDSYFDNFIWNANISSGVYTTIKSAPYEVSFSFNYFSTADIQPGVNVAQSSSIFNIVEPPARYGIRFTHYTEIMSDDPVTFPFNIYPNTHKSLWAHYESTTPPKIYVYIDGHSYEVGEAFFLPVPLRYCYVLVDTLDLSVVYEHIPYDGYYDGLYFDLFYQRPVEYYDLVYQPFPSETVVITGESLTLYPKYVSRATGDTLVDGVFSVANSFISSTGQICDMVFGANIDIVGYSLFSLIVLGSVITIILSKGRRK